MKHRVSAALTAAFVALLLPFPAAAAEGDAAALLAKHAAFVGWSAGDGKVQSLRKVGTLKTATGVETVENRWLGIAHRTITTLPNGLRHESGFTGRVPWVANANGFVLQPAGDGLKQAYDDQALSAEQLGAFQAAVHGHATIGGVPTTIVRLTSQLGFPIDVAIDPATGAFKRTVVDPDGAYQETTDEIVYREIGGRRFIESYVSGGARRPLRYDRIEVNAPLTPDDLHPPKQGPSWSFGDAPASIELTEYRVFVDAVVNGTKGRFIFDTGAGGTAFTPRFVDRAKLRRVGDTRIGGIAGSTSASVVRVDTIALGGSTLHDVVATDALKANMDADGLLGADVLAGAIVELDLDAKTLRIMDPTKVAPSSNGLVLHPDLSSFHIVVPMKLDGRIDVAATLDSGNPVNVLFSPTLVTRDHVVLGPDPNLLARYRLGSGIAGTYEVEHCGKLSALQLGPVVYRPVPGCESGSMYGNEVLVGLEFMRAFNYVFDYPDGVIVLQKRRGT